MNLRDEDVFAYHEFPRPGKLEVMTSKPCLTQRDLSLAYTPGVAIPCRAIHANPDDAYRFTGRGNLVAVVTNGTAVLGLGDIGPLAGKPVMEGKATLFKTFADVDVFDIELNASDPDEVIRVVKALEPTFGGINLEDIKAPECFYIEETLRREMAIPVFHDDQHGTAIISSAALLNALDLAGKRIEEVRVVFAGAGAAGIACADMFVELGVRREHVLLVDTKGVVYTGRTEKMNPYKARFAAETSRRTLEEALEGADVFVGVSAADTVTPDMLRGMAASPIVFALANPDPEISYDLAVRTRADVFMATGRSDFPNQVNNVLGFPFIFRGALDVRASTITGGMKMAAARALAALAREHVPEQVLDAYGIEELTFGREYLIPKPFDPRVLLWVAPAVAEAAMADGVARRPIADMAAYRASLERHMGPAREVVRLVARKARAQAPHRVVYPDGEHEAVLRAVRETLDQQQVRPVLIGRPEVVRAGAARLDLPEGAFDIVDPALDPSETYADALYSLRQRKGMTPAQAAIQARDPITRGLLMLQLGEVDGFVGGVTRAYPDTIRPALQIIGLQPGVTRAAAVHLLVLPKRLLFFADTMVNIEPNAEELAEIACLTADVARLFDVEPRVAMLAFSSFGSVRGPLPERVAAAVALARARRPDLIIDGEMHAETALVPAIAAESYPHSRVQGDANVLIFPGLAAGNIGYQLVRRLSRAEVLGPFLLGLRKPVSVLHPGVTAAEIAGLSAVTALGVRFQDAAANLLSRNPEVTRA
ncbi:MAG: NADP-dependent malic enzyme [Vicinamibacterales bacterium]